MQKLKHYLQAIKTNAKVFYDEQTYENEKQCNPYGLVALAPLVCITIAVITPLTIVSYIFNGQPLMFVCWLFWVLVLWWALAILFRNL
jgi:hypothetical protein